MAKQTQKKVAIIQSNYIPWKGYFDIINSVDEFIIYDDMQYTKRDWRNRNRIVTSTGLLWLTIPVKVKGKFFQKISETEVGEDSWNKKHWTTLTHHYKKTPFFNDYKDSIEELYLNCNEKLLSKVNYRFLEGINSLLGIKTKMIFSSEFSLVGEKSERLLNICKQAEATTYLSGPSAKTYLDENLFHQENIQVEWMDYSNYPEYPQLYSPFEHGVTVFDLIFNTGTDACKYMKSFKVL